MIFFFPPENEVKSAGESHLLLPEEARWGVGTGTLMWDDTRKGYVLAPGKDWHDYVRAMNDVNLDDIPDYEDEHYSDWGDPEPFD